MDAWGSDACPRIIAMAEQVLRQLATGQLGAVQPFLGANREVNEDERGHVRLMYWVSRAGGSGGEEHAWFELKLVENEWQLVTYNAVY